MNNQTDSHTLQSHSHSEEDALITVDVGDEYKCLTGWSTRHMPTPLWMGII